MEASFIPQSEYLFTHGVDENTPAEKVAALKKQHRKEYQKWYAEKKMREDGKAVQIRLTKQEMKQFRYLARKHNIKHLGPFIKASALAYREDRYLVPNSDEVKSLEHQIRAIGRNVNVIAKKAAKGKRMEAKDLYDAGSQVVTLANLVEQYYQKPPLVLGESPRNENQAPSIQHEEKMNIKDVYDFLYQYLTDHPEDIRHFQKLLDSLKVP